jgi:hypothetical protein
MGKTDKKVKFILPQKQSLVKREFAKRDKERGEHIMGQSPPFEKLFSTPLPGAITQCEPCRCLIADGLITRPHPQKRKCLKKRFDPFPSAATPVFPTALAEYLFTRRFRPHCV